MESIKDLPEIPACAAIKLATGLIVADKRHDGCLAQLKNIGLTEQAKMESTKQGFMTNRGRFVSREDATILMQRAELKSVYTSKVPSKGILFSEDLY